MFEKLKQEFFWDQIYDREWKSAGGEFLGQIIFGTKCIRDGRRWDKLIEGTRLIWKEQGRRICPSPRVAVFHAMKEIADEFYREFCQTDPKDPSILMAVYEVKEYWESLDSPRYQVNLEQVLRKIAAYLWGAAPYDIKGPDGMYLSREEHLGTRWQSYHEAYAKGLRDKETRVTEVRSHKFARDEIERAWQELCDGNIPLAAKAVWKASPAPRRSAHKIAEQANVSLKDAFFWVIVFRQHGLIEEFARPFEDENLYVRVPVHDASRPQEMSSVVQRLMS